MIIMIGRLSCSEFILFLLFSQSFRLYNRFYNRTNMILKANLGP